MNYDLLRAVNNGANIQDMNLRVVDYVRVSTASREQRKSFENQLDTYRQMIEDNPNWTYSGTYSDEAVTGTKVYMRGGFQQMIADAQAGLFDLIIVKDVARFARNIKECLVYKDKLKSCGVMIWFVKEGINSFRSKDEMLLQWMAMGAEMEAENARSRTKIVFEQGIQRGKVYGNSKILGYTKDHCKLVVDEEEAETVRLIFDLYVHQRMGLRRIAKELAERGITRKDGTQIPTRTLKTVLENPKYKGFYCGGKTEKLDMGERYVRRELPENEWVMYKDPAIPAIVSEALWDEAAQIRKERQGKYREEVTAPCNQGIYRYSGKIVSGFDAAPGVSFTRCLYRYKGINREGWQCRNYKDAAHPGNIGPTLYSDELDTIVQGMLHDLLGGYDTMIADLMRRYQSATTGQQIEKRMETLKKEQETIEKKRRKLLDLYEDDAITKDEYMTRSTEHKSRLNAIQSEREMLKASSEKSRQMLVQLDGLKQSVKRMAEEGTPSKETIDSLIDKIVVRGDSTKKAINLEITLKVIAVTQAFQILRNRKQNDVSCSCCNQRN
ncbi:recombinase family protein [uncultured Ruthenibacterium sp.]|uniref:recombinase family protein n=1 Tax=uncultured Ruthenibacterium sp. TaxID=1905347 RepID=UPI00349E7980